jgi:inorganic pyrophosphatase
MTPFRSSLRIETPKASRNKYSYDPEQGIFILRKVLPEGMVFPHDFGFLPRTLASDGDPIDVLTELEAFFVNYHGLEGKKYKLLGCKEAKTAFDLVENPRELPLAPNEMTRQRQLLRASDSPAELYSCRLAGQVFGW